MPTLTSIITYFGSQISTAPYSTIVTPTVFSFNSPVALAVGPPVALNFTVGVDRQVLPINYSFNIGQTLVFGFTTSSTVGLTSGNYPLQVMADGVKFYDPSPMQWLNFGSGRFASGGATFTDSGLDFDLGTPGGTSAFQSNDINFFGTVLDFPAVDFTGTPRIMNSGESATFTDVSTFGTSWLWEFQGLSGGWLPFTTSTVQNPTQTFASAGAYDIRLTVDGTTTKRKDGYILVRSSCGLGADIYVSTTSGEKLSTGTIPEGNAGARGPNKLRVTMIATGDRMNAGGLVWEKKLTSDPDSAYVIFYAIPAKEGVTHIFDAENPYAVNEEELQQRLIDSWP